MSQLSTTQPNPDEPQATEPGKKRNWFARHKILTGIGAVILLAIVVTTLTRGGDSEEPAGELGASSTEGDTTEDPKEPEEPAEPGIGTPVESGGLEFTVDSIEEAGTEVGSEYLKETAQGRYLSVQITVSNVSKEPVTFFLDNQELIDTEGRTFSPDSTATLYVAENTDTWLSEINPGNSIAGAIYFDLPADATASSITVKGELFGDGVTISLK